MSKKYKQELGTIELGDKVYVSDPCYRVGTWCQAFVEGLKPGKYYGFMYKKDFGPGGFGGIRVTDLWIAHENYIKNYPTKILDKGIDIGVDSGSAGIFDKEYFEKYHILEEGKYMDDYPESSEWYDKQFDLRYYYDINGEDFIEPHWVDDWTFNEDGTINNSGKGHWEYSGQERREGIALDNKCVISFSGFGDGGYDLYAGKNSKGEIISLRIRFI